MNEIKVKVERPGGEEESVGSSLTDNLLVRYLYHQEKEVQRN